MSSFSRFKRWLYHDLRPNWIARLLNAGWRAVHSSGIAPDYLATLEVVGRKSGKQIAFPVVIALFEQQRYLVSMLGDDAQWVKNVRAANHIAHIRSGQRTEVRLDEVPVGERAAILKAYLQRAPGARPHIRVHKDAPLDAFKAVEADFPVFRIVPTSQ